MPTFDMTFYGPTLTGDHCDAGAGWVVDSLQMPAGCRPIAGSTYCCPENALPQELADLALMYDTPAPQETSAPAPVQAIAEATGKTADALRTIFVPGSGSKTPATRRPTVQQRASVSPWLYAGIGVGALTVVGLAVWAFWPKGGAK